MIHRTTKVSEAHSIDSMHALQRLFVLNAMMSRCADACLPGIEQCRATGYPVPQWPVQRRCHDDTTFQRNSHFDEFRRALRHAHLYNANSQNHMYEQQATLAEAAADTRTASR